MTVEIKVPSLGESINEVQIGKWLKQAGDFVEVDEPMVEIESDKASQELPAPSAGRIVEILKQDGEMANVGDLIATLDETATAGASPAPKAEKPAPKAEKPAPKPAPKPQPAPAAPQKKTTTPAHDAAVPPVAARKTAPVTPEHPAPAAAPPQPEPQLQAPQAPMPGPIPPSPPEEGAAPVMPAARRLLAEHGIDAAAVTPSGPGGRMLKEDVERYIATVRHVAAPIPNAPVTEKTADRSDKITPMSPMRRTIAKRLVEAQQTAALLTTFNEIDMTAVMDLRARFKQPFQERHGYKLGFTGFFVKALVEALRLFPQINAEIRGNDIVYHNYYDIGIAVGSGSKGLVVPVLRSADRLSFAEIEAAIADFGKRAKENRIQLEELQGGTFTISNGGVYGSLLSTPIVNPPQSGILGLHAIQDRPIARDGQVVIRPMMYIALTYDHRLVDGREAVTFLKRIKECVEDPARILMEI